MLSVFAPRQAPHPGTITEQQYQQLQAIPTLLAALEAAQRALSDPLPGVLPTIFLVAKTLEKFAALGAIPVETQRKTGPLNAEGDRKADRASIMVDQYQGLFRTDDSDLGLITDLLTDLMFLSDREELNFQTMIAAAEIHYESER